MNPFWTVHYDIRKRLFGYAWEVSTTGQLVVTVKGWHRTKAGAEDEARATQNRVCDVLVEMTKEQQRIDRLQAWDRLVIFDDFLT